MMYPLYLCSFVALVIILAKWTELLWAEHKTKSFTAIINPLLQKGEGAKIRDMGRVKGSPLERVFHFTKEKEEKLSKNFELQVNEETERLESLLPVLAVIARISPLLGLLGTVVGMIKVFYRIELFGGSVDAASLGGGIWMALLTTACGLSIAIPVIVFHQYFLRKINRITSQMSNLLERLLLEIDSSED